MPNPLPYVGQNIRSQRESWELSLEYVAQKVGISVSMLDSIERGDVPVNAAWLPRFAETLGCSINALVSHDDVLDDVWHSSERLEKRFNVTLSAEMRKRLMIEEYNEVLDAIKNKGRGDIAAEIADLLVTAFGVARAHGITLNDMRDHMRRVVEKNNAKTEKTHHVYNGKIRRIEFAKE